MIDWSYEPEGPFTLHIGTYDVHDNAHHLYKDEGLTLEEVVDRFARHLPSLPTTWSAITITDDRLSRPVLARAHHADGVLHWRGCKVLFDALADRWRPATDVAWWAIQAENVDAFKDVDA